MVVTPYPAFLSGPANYDLVLSIWLLEECFDVCKGVQKVAWW
jgi:hypothetical protein